MRLRESRLIYRVLWVLVVMMLVMVVVVKEGMCISLGDIEKWKEEKNVEALIMALRDEDSDVRKAAAEALGEIGDKRAVGVLISALEDKDLHSEAWEVLMGILRSDKLSLAQREEIIDKIDSALPIKVINIDGVSIKDDRYIQS
ncbi:MAG: HEAT repeat domain-containing protein [Thermodesulfobacteria bacterium]|nr:HEAT repeat domain-containing protein [Thermodesulfobacteriota bacterium]